MNRRRRGWCLLLAAVLCGLVAVLVPAAASDAATPGVQVSVNGGAFGASVSGPLLDVDGLAPGGSTSATLGVHSTMPDLSSLYLRLHGVRDDDNGCVGPERAVDTTCGPGQGDLGRSLRFTIAVARGRNGPYSTTWAGTASQLERDIDAGVQVLPGDDRWVRLAATLPTATGAAVESDSFGFALTVSLVGSTRTAHVEAISAHRGHGHSGSGFGTDAASTSVLASTGFAVSLYVAAGVLFIGAGGCLVFTSRRRRTAAT